MSNLSYIAGEFVWHLNLNMLIFNPHLTQLLSLNVFMISSSLDFKISVEIKVEVHNNALLIMMHIREQRLEIF